MEGRERRRRRAVRRSEERGQVRGRKDSAEEEEIGEWEEEQGAEQ